MFFGTPNEREERPDHDGQPHVTSDDDEQASEDDDAAEEASTVQRLVAGARTLSDLLKPFTGLIASIVHLLTIHKALNSL